ncbi:hypothetical protein M6B38_383575 [Iris pallida]|uniref:Uncharacterized protein n=1 Tax=Iris pallida TaxID=29817 RepID=A0AAX6G4R7_IRIPA|nr:hypothetical protein M6B38_383575 [Iris pallida]
MSSAPAAAPHFDRHRSASAAAAASNTVFVRIFRLKI